MAGGAQIKKHAWQDRDSLESLLIWRSEIWLNARAHLTTHRQAYRAGSARVLGHIAYNTRGSLGRWRGSHDKSCISCLDWRAETVRGRGCADKRCGDKTVNRSWLTRKCQYIRQYPGWRKAAECGAMTACHTASAKVDECSEARHR